MCDNMQKQKPGVARGQSEEAVTRYTIPGRLQEDRTLTDVLQACVPLWRAWMVGQEEKQKAVRVRGWELVEMTAVWVRGQRQGSWSCFPSRAPLSLL